MRKLVDAPRKKKQWTEKEEAYLQCGLFHRRHPGVLRTHQSMLRMFSLLVFSSAS